MKVKVRLIGDKSNRTELIHEKELDMLVAKVVELVLEWKEDTHTAFAVSEIKE